MATPTDDTLLTKLFLDDLEEKTIEQETKEHVAHIKKKVKEWNKTKSRCFKSGYFTYMMLPCATFTGKPVTPEVLNKIYNRTYKALTASGYKVKKLSSFTDRGKAFKVYYCKSYFIRIVDWIFKEG